MFGNFFKSNDAPAAPATTEAKPVVVAPAAGTEVNPLDAYTDMLDPTKHKTTDIKDLTGKLFNLSDEAMDQELANANLLVIDQAQLTALKESGMSDAAIAAHMQVMNNSLKQVMKMAAKTSAGAVTHGLNGSASFVGNQVTQTLAKHNATEAVRSLGGAIDHPAMATFREPLVNALAAQYPNASQTELRTHAESMFNNMMTGMGYEKKAAPKADPEAIGRDFSSWLTPNVN